jgi:uncharacterized protein (TIGR02246 family)
MPPDVEADLLELHAIRERLQAAENSGDAGYIGGMMADDAVIMVPSQPVQQGRAACAAFIREILPGLLEQFHRRIAYRSDEVRVIGGFAFDRGRFEFTVLPKSGGQATQAAGKYFWLYSSTGEGGWKLARLIMSLDEEGEEDRARPSLLRRALAAAARYLTAGRK